MQDKQVNTNIAQEEYSCHAFNDNGQSTILFKNAGVKNFDFISQCDTSICLDCKK
jgi:hypothetical protein